MAWEWVGPVVTGCVAVAGLATNIVISVSAGRTQRAMMMSAHQLEAESARRGEKKDVYTRFIGAADAWNRALPPVQRAIKELVETQGDAALAGGFDIGQPNTLSEIRVLLETFHELDASFDVVRLVASEDVFAPAEAIRTHVEDSTFALLRGPVLKTPYIPREIQERCTAEMSIDLGYRSPVGGN